MRAGSCCMHDAAADRRSHRALLHRPAAHGRRRRLALPAAASSRPLAAARRLLPSRDGPGVQAGHLDRRHAALTAPRPPRCIGGRGCPPRCGPLGPPPGSALTRSAACVAPCAGRSRRRAQRSQGAQPASRHPQSRRRLSAHSERSPCRAACARAEAAAGLSALTERSPRRAIRKAAAERAALTQSAAPASCHPRGLAAPHRAAAARRASCHRRHSPPHPPRGRYARV